MSAPSEISLALVETMLQQKRLAIEGLRQLCARRARRSTSWWAWTVWLAHGMTVQRIENA